jgi:hypothetical protein
VDYDQFSCLKLKITITTHKSMLLLKVTTQPIFLQDPKKILFSKESLWHKYIILTIIIIYLFWIFFGYLMLKSWIFWIFNG